MISVHDCAGVVAAVHAAVVLLVHPRWGRRASARACARRSRPPRARAASRRGGPSCAASSVAPSSVVSKTPMPWTIAQKLSRRRRRRTSAPRGRGGPAAGCPGRPSPRCPAGRRASRAATRSSPSSRLSKIPGASTPASTRPCAAASVETFDSLRPPRRRRAPRSRASTSRRGRCCARPPSRATRSPRRRRSSPERRIEHRVVDGPALAVGAAELPVAPVGVALEQEAALAGSDQQQCPCQRLTSGVGVRLVLLDGRRARDSSLICARKSLLRRFGATVGRGRLAQLGEHLPYKQGVAGSSPAPPIGRSASATPTPVRRDESGGRHPRRRRPPRR